MIIIQNKILPPKGYKAITLFGLVFARKELTEVDKNHERIHIYQGREMLWIFFYLWYVIEYYIKRIFIYGWKNKNQSYRNISFEREAYTNDKNLDYLSSRKWYSWVKYL